MCIGNICRSPFAERSLRRRIEERDGTANGTHVRSAGLLGADVPSPPDACRAAAARSADLENHRSAPLTAEAARKADLVVVMDGRQSRTVQRIAGLGRDRILVLGDLDPEPIERRGIADPLNKPLEFYESCYARIDRCLDELVQAWSPEGHPAESRSARV